MFADSMPPVVRRLVLAGAVVLGILAWNTASATSQPAGRATHTGPPHFMLAAPQHRSPHSGSAHRGATLGPHNSCCTPPLINNKGPVESPARVYLDFWGPQWNAGWPDTAFVACGGGFYNQCTPVGPDNYSNAAATVENYVTGFFKAVATGTSPNWNHSQSQYGSKVPPVYGGSFVDAASTPPTPVVTDNCADVCIVGEPSTLSQVATEAIAAESHFGYSPNADYMIFLPQGSFPPNTFAGACAYHDEVFDPQGRKISYSVIPYLPDIDKSQALTCGQNYINTTNDAYGHGFLDGYSIVGGHEMAEAETDPFPFTAPAWQGSDGSETGDICAWGTVTTYPAGNVRTSTNFWVAQSLWSNSARACVMN